MAIFQSKVNKISKSKSKKGGSRSTDYINRENEFSGKDDLIYKEEKNIPTEFKDGKEFVDIMEKNIRSNARLFKKYEKSLPIEFSHEKNIEIAKEFCEKQFGEKYVYFMAVHDPDGEHPHMHVNVFERKIDGVKRENKETYFKRGNKKNPEKSGWYADRECNKKKYYTDLCQTWEDTLNKHLVDAGYPKLKPKPKEKKQKKEKEKFYSVKEIKEMNAKEITDLLLIYESQLNEKITKRDTLYKKMNGKKKLEEKVINEFTDNQLYKLDNRIIRLKGKQKSKNITSKEKIETFKQIKSLEEKKKSIIKEHIGTETFERVKKQIQHKEKKELKQLNKEIEIIRKKTEKIISHRPKDEMREISHKLLKKKIYLSKSNIEKKGKVILKSKTKSQQKDQRNTKRDFLKAKKNLIIAVSLGRRIFKLAGVGKTQASDSYGKLINLQMNNLNKNRENEKTIFSNDLEQKNNDLSNEREEKRKDKGTEKSKEKDYEYEH